MTTKSSRKRLVEKQCWYSNAFCAPRCWITTIVNNLSVSYRQVEKRSKSSITKLVEKLSIVSRVNKSTYNFQWLFYVLRFNFDFKQVFDAGAPGTISRKSPSREHLIQEKEQSWAEVGSQFQKESSYLRLIPYGQV